MTICLLSKNAYSTGITDKTRPSQNDGRVSHERGGSCLLKRQDTNCIFQVKACGGGVICTEVELRFLCVILFPAPKAFILQGPHVWGLVCLENIQPFSCCLCKHSYLLQPCLALPCPTLPLFYPVTVGFKLSLHSTLILPCGSLPTFMIHNNLHASLQP